MEKSTRKNKKGDKVPRKYKLDYRSDGKLDITFIRMDKKFWELHEYANIIAKIGSKQITSADLSFDVSSQQFLLKQRFPDQTIENEFLVEISIESLIRKFGILNFIESNNLYLTDSFVFRQLAKEEQFLENGKFSNSPQW